MLRDNTIPLIIGCFWIGVVHTNIIGAEWTMIVGIGLSIWNRIEFAENMSRAFQ